MVHALLFALDAISAAQANSNPWLGRQKAAVVMLEWANAPRAITAGDAQAAFFGDDSSLRKYFLENSQGKLDLSGQIYNWNRSSLDWDPLKGCQADVIAAEAWKVFQRIVEIVKFDADGDGKIDQLFVIHSGRLADGAHGPECVFASSPFADRVVVLPSQGVGSHGNGIPLGFYLHEAGHQYFSIPDQFEDDLRGQYGAGIWSVMGLGQWSTNAQIDAGSLYQTPAHFDPASKIRVGWANPAVVRASQAGMALRPVETSGDIAAIPLPSGDTLYLEYRSSQGFSARHPGHGLLIWKNSTLIQADGRDDLHHGHALGYEPFPPTSENLGDASDPFPGSLGVTSYVDPVSGVRIEHITQTDAQITFDVTVPVRN